MRKDKEYMFVQDEYRDDYKISSSYTMKAVSFSRRNNLLKGLYDAGFF
jgi:hypothetical protein